MCHESSGSALTETIGIGKGTVSIEDVHEADLLIVAGQNPGTNHPRMLSALEKAKRSVATECLCCVRPIAQHTIVDFEVRTDSPTRRGVLSGTPVAATSSGHEASVIAC